jgi:hypothetical protein
MQRYDRRQFLTRMSAGLAVAGAAAYLPRQAISAAGASIKPATAGGAVGTGVGQIHDVSLEGGAVPLAGDVVDGPVIAYVRDASAGDISIFVGSREIVVQDRVIAASLARAARKGV